MADSEGSVPQTETKKSLIRSFLPAKLVNFFNPFSSSKEDGGGQTSTSLKEEGNQFMEAGDYLKAAALYTKAIKKDPNNSVLYSNRSAAFLHLLKLDKSLADAEMAIKLNPSWHKGHFRKGEVLQAMGQPDEAHAAFIVSAECAIPQNTESSMRLDMDRMLELWKDKQRALQVDQKMYKPDMAKHLRSVKSELLKKYRPEESCEEIFIFLVETMETAINTWHETSELDPRVYFLFDEEKRDRFAPLVTDAAAFGSSRAHSRSFSYFRKYAADSSSRAACVITTKKWVSYPQVWNGQGCQRWTHGDDGLIVQFESPALRKLWFLPFASALGISFCRDPEILDIGVHEIGPCLFPEM